MHGDGGEVPALLDARFAKKWERSTLKELFTTIKETMPLNRPGTLTSQDASDVLAYILQRNGRPAGARELAHEPDELSLIVFDQVDSALH